MICNIKKINNVSAKKETKKTNCTKHPHPYPC